ncbi:MAG: hypothetical protein ACKVQB_10685 [Bacteroidia bacterium]
MFNLGLAKSDLYQKVFVLDLSTNVGQLYPRSQKSATFFDLNVTYIFKTNKWICKPIIGVAYSPIGFIEEGTTLNDSQKVISYYLPVKLQYVSLFGGLQFNILAKNKFDLKISQTLNPMLDINKTIAVLRKFGVMARTSVVVDIKLKNGGIVCLAPFFNTSITKFNKNKKIAESPNYYPYSYGLNLGTYFKH